MDLSKFGLYLNLFCSAPSLSELDLFLDSSTELLLLLLDWIIQSGDPPPLDEEGVLDKGGETGGDSDPGEISKLSLNPPRGGRTSKKWFSIGNWFDGNWFGIELKLSLACDAASALAAAIECWSWWKYGLEKKLACCCCSWLTKFGFAYGWNLGDGLGNIRWSKIGNVAEVGGDIAEGGGDIARSSSPAATSTSFSSSLMMLSMVKPFLFVELLIFWSFGDVSEVVVSRDEVVSVGDGKECWGIDRL